MVCLGLVTSIAKAAGPDLESARNLIVGGKPAEAYLLLEPYEFEQAGNTNFDYLLGVAALNSGQAGKASLILERVLAVDPLYAAVWVDLGRAYYLLGDIGRARMNFKHAETLNPPPPALATIKQYLGATEAQANKTPARLSGYFEAGVGHNNNINNSTSQSQISVPVLINTQLVLNPANVKTADGYWGLATGGEAALLASAEWLLYAGVDMRSRNGLKYSNFDFTSLDGRIGASFSRNTEQIRGGVVAGQFDLGGTVNSKSSGYNFEWKHAFNDTNQAVLFDQHIRYRYPAPALSSNDFNQTITGLGLIHTFPDGRSTVSGSFIGGNESATNLRVDGGKKIQAVRLSGQSPWGEKYDLFASGGVQRGKYDQTNSAFLVVRDDSQADLTAGLIYRHAPDWALRAQISRIQNQSNIVVNRYDQTDLSLTLRRDFK